MNHHSCALQSIFVLSEILVEGCRLPMVWLTLNAWVYHCTLWCPPYALCSQPSDTFSVPLFQIIRGVCFNTFHSLLLILV